MIIGILPRKGKEKQIKELNLKIAQLSDLVFVEFRDIGSQLLLEDSIIDKSLFTDGLHPNRKGYEIIAKKLKRIIKDE